MGADDRRHPPVEPACECRFLARRLGVNVNEDDGGLLAHLVDEFVDELEHGSGGMQEERAEDVDDPESLPVRGRHHGDAATGGVAGGIRRAYDALRRGEVFTDLGPSKSVVPEGDRVDAHGQDLLGEARRDADTVRCVLPVHHTGIDGELRSQRRQSLL